MFPLKLCPREWGYMWLFFLTKPYITRTELLYSPKDGGRGLSGWILELSLNKLRRHPRVICLLDLAQIDVEIFHDWFCLFCVSSLGIIPVWVSSCQLRGMPVDKRDATHNYAYGLQLRKMKHVLSDAEAWLKFHYLIWHLTQCKDCAEHHVDFHVFV